MPPVNYLAILVSAAAVFAIGAVWYSTAMFARPWATANGYTPQKLEAMKKRMVLRFGISFLSYLVMAAMLSVLIYNLDIDTAAGGAKLGGVVWLGFAATTGLTGNLFSDKPITAWVIDAGYQLVSLIVMGITLAVWR